METTITATTTAPRFATRAAAEHARDLIAMSTHALTGLKRAVLGSVADAVMRTAAGRRWEDATRASKGRGTSNAGGPSQLSVVGTARALSCLAKEPHGGLVGTGTLRHPGIH